VGATDNPGGQAAPAGHGCGATWPGQKNPEGHSAKWVAPTPEPATMGQTLPAGHGLQAMDPGLSLYVWGGQGTNMTRPAVPHEVPGGHGMGAKRLSVSRSGSLTGA